MLQSQPTCWQFVVVVVVIVVCRLNIFQIFSTIWWLVLLLSLLFLLLLFDYLCHGLTIILFNNNNIWICVALIWTIASYYDQTGQPHHIQLKTHFVVIVWSLCPLRRQGGGHPSTLHTIIYPTIPNCTCKASIYNQRGGFSPYTLHCLGSIVSILQSRNLNT